MTTEDFTIELFYRLDQELLEVEKHSQAKLYPSARRAAGFLVRAQRCRQSGLLALVEKRLATFVSQLAGANTFVSSV